MMRYLCCDERRRSAVAGRTDLNGIAFLELAAASTAPSAALTVHFINPGSIPAITAANVAITGGAVIRNIAAVSATMATTAAGEPVLTVTCDRAGDFSVYQLMIVAGSGSLAPLGGMDPILNAVDFTFRPGCESDGDIVLPASCPPAIAAAPPIDYLSRDFNSLRQLLLDRMAVLGAALPSDDPLDLGVTLVELLAYAGDQLSYRQDAIATEATLQTARQRISARRHARLIDYVMHNGCNARAFVVATLKPGAQTSVAARTQLLTAVPALGGASRITADSDAYATALAQGALVFETLDATVALDSRLDGMRFHSWGGQGCCLPKGATSATLIGDLAGPTLLYPGRVIVLREMVDPATGDPALADPAHRCAVRLLSVAAASDPIGGGFLTPAQTDPLAVTEIAWGPADALAFPLCVSTEADPDTGVPALADVSLAYGNVLLADHGMSLAQPELLGSVPASSMSAITAAAPPDSLTDTDLGPGCQPDPLVAIPARFNPILSQGPLTHACPYAPGPDDGAATLLAVAVATARPAIAALTSRDGAGDVMPWTLAFPDMISADAEAVYVVEVDNTFRGRLRFGDGTNGRVAPEGATFTASYRVGNGQAGNVGAGTIACVVDTDDAIVAIGNPMAATGGTDAETVEAVRRHAPAAFAVQQRAVTPQDYADRAMSQPGVLRASDTLRWTGSWYTHVLAVDRLGGQDLDAGFVAGLDRALETVRLAGHDLQIVEPLIVAVELALAVTVQGTYFRSAVRQALLAVLNDAPGGLFYPDRFTFGQALYLSPVMAAVQSTPGVAAVTVTTFRRLGQPATDATASGRLAMAPSEIARLDNDPNNPERGVLRLALAGGR